MTLYESGNVAIPDGNLSIGGELDLPSSGKIDWSSGDAYIQEGVSDNYAIDFHTYDGTAASMVLSLKGDNTALFKGKIAGESVVTSGGKKLAHGILDLSFSTTPTQIKITTGIPYPLVGADFTVSIKGFAYGLSRSVDLKIHWHNYLNQFYNANISNAGSWTPTVKLAVENSKVVIHLSPVFYWGKMYVESMYSSNYPDLYQTGWSWADSAISSDSSTPTKTLDYYSRTGGQLIIDGTTTASGNVTVNADLTLGNGNNNGVLNLKTYDDASNNWVIVNWTDDTLRMNYNGAGADEFILTNTGQLTTTGGLVSNGLTINGNALIDGQLTWGENYPAAYAYSNTDSSGLFVEVIDNNTDKAAIRFQTRVNNSGSYTMFRISADDSQFYFGGGQLYVNANDIKLRSSSDGNNGILRLADDADTEGGQVYSADGNLNLYSPNDIKINADSVLVTNDNTVTSDWGNKGIISNFAINVADRIYGSFVLQDNAVFYGAGIGLSYSVARGYDMHFGTAPSASTTFNLETRMTISGLGKVGIGIREGDGTLHVHSGSAGTVSASSQADELVLESNTETGMTIISPDDQSARIRFTSPSTNNDTGGATIFYRQNINKMNVGTAVAGGRLSLQSGASDEKILLDGNVNLFADVLLRSYQIPDSGGGYYGDYGYLNFYANANFSSSSRQYALTNALEVNKFGIIYGDSYSRQPTLTTTGALGTGTSLALSINNAGVTRLQQLGIGLDQASWDTSSLSLDVASQVSFRSFIYSGITTASAGGWKTRQYANGSTHEIHAQALVVNNIGYANPPVTRLRAYDRGITTTGAVGAVTNTAPNAVMKCGHFAVTSGTGSIVIQLPGSRSSGWSMPVIRVTTYEYSADAANVYYISGHNWTSGWYNNSVHHHGNNPEPVYLLGNSTTNKSAIFIGAGSTSRSYLHVTVDLMSHPSFYDSTFDAMGAWTISLMTSSSGWSGSSNLTETMLHSNVGTTGDYSVASLVSSGNVTAYSDRKLKEDVQPLSGALQSVMSLQGVQYVRKDTGEKDIGFIAQQVEEDCPEIAERVVKVANKDEDIKGINYQNMVALLAEAIKDQQHQIETLTKTIKEIKNGDTKD